MAIFLQRLLQNSLLRTLPRYNVRNTSTKKQKKKKTDKGPKYFILRAKSEDYPKIIKLMWASYYDSEPTLVALGIRPNACMDESILKTLEEGISVVAKCKYDGKILGACLNETTNPWEPDFMDKMACTMTCPKMRALYHFQAHLQRLTNLWKCYHIPKIFEMSYLVTRKGHRKKGMGTALVRASRDIAADCGYKVARIDCTNHYSSLICKKLKMKLVTEIPYCSYIGEDLDPIFKTSSPHNKVQIYVDDALHERR